MKFSLPLEKSEKEYYSGIGYAVNSMSDLEFEIDRFLFAASSVDAKFCTKFSKAYPSAFSDKFSLIEKSFDYFHHLKCSLRKHKGMSLKKAKNSFDEVVIFRNALLHSKKCRIIPTKAGFTTRIQRLARTKTKNQFEYKFSEFGFGYLEKMVSQCNEIVSFLRTYRIELEGEEASNAWNERMNKIVYDDSKGVWEEIIK